MGVVKVWMFCFLGNRVSETTLVSVFVVGTVYWVSVTLWQRMQKIAKDVGTDCLVCSCE